MRKGERCSSLEFPAHRAQEEQTFHNHPFGQRRLLQPRCPIRHQLSRTEGEVLGALRQAYREPRPIPTRPTRLLAEVRTSQPLGPWTSALV